MVDLETMAKTSRSAIVQIGACFFDPETGSRVGREFEMNVDLQDCIDLGLETDGDTIAFWMKEPRKYWLEGEVVNLEIALQALSEFVRQYKEEKLVVWNHATFDAPILESAYQAVMMEMPFEYRSVRDIRTLYDIADYHPNKKENPNPHSAIADCVFQAKGVAAALKKIKEAREKKEEA